MADGSLSACLAEIKANPGKFYVYLLSRPCKTPFYVGCGRGNRISMHDKEARSLRRSRKLSIIRKLRRSEDAVLYRIDSWWENQREALVREMACITELGRLDIGTGPLANLTSGGDGARDMSEATLRRLSASLKSSDKARLQRQRMAQAKKGKPHSASHAAAIKAAHRSPKWLAANRRATDAQRGRTYSAETLCRMSEAARGRKISDETKAKLSAAQRRNWQEDDSRLRAAARRICEKNSAARRGKPLPPQHSAAAIAGMRSYWADEERCRASRQKLSEATRRNWANPEFREMMRGARSK